MGVEFCFIDYLMSKRIFQVVKRFHLLYNNEE